MTGSPIRAVIAEDHALFREGTRRILEQQDDMVVAGEADNGATAVELCSSLTPDIALLDIRMSDLSGVEATRQIRAKAPGTAILILSAHDDDRYVRAVLEAGASGYLLKTIRADELVDAIRRVIAGEIVLHPEIARKLARLLTEKGHPELGDLHLTAKEVMVLRLTCRGLHNKEIARQLSMSVRTVEGHLDCIFDKLNIRSRTEIAVYAANHGWFAEGDGEG